MSGGYQSKCRGDGRRVDRATGMRGGEGTKETRGEALGLPGGISAGWGGPALALHSPLLSWVQRTPLGSWL